MAGSDDRPEPARDASVEELTDDIEHTRHEVGETVSALTDKLDVKGRAQAAVVDTKERVTDAVTDDQGAVRPGVPVVAIVVATAAVVLGVIVWRHRR
jgi:cobalamin biosynthesis Mg chelatase CobN